jgi:hypothetical protein
MKANSGCFVYKVLSGVGLRRAPSVEDKYRLGPTKAFATGDIVSVDLVVHETGPGADVSHGPYLRLSDGSGWLFERKGSTQCLMALDVEEGFWSFYVDNEPVGMAVRNHPMDDGLESTPRGIVFKQELTLPPMQRVFCDRRVIGKNGVSFYRLQDEGYSSWVFDKRVTSNGETHYMMHPESKVRCGLFAFRAVSHVAIRSQANVGDDVRTDRIVYENDLIVCDIIRESPQKYGNGPFLRLADGTGWLFEYKEGERMMVEVPIVEGIWRLRVANSCGIMLRKQPSDATKSLFPRSLHKMMWWCVIEKSQLKSLGKLHSTG